MLLDDGLKHASGSFQVIGGELRVVSDATLGPETGEDILERGVLHAKHDIAVHLHEPPIGVPGKVGVARPLDERLDNLVVHAQVEDGVHHPRHRELCARPDRQEDRSWAGPEGASGGLLQPRDRMVHLAPEIWGELSRGHGLSADLGGDGEPRGDGEPQPGHFGKPGAFSAEEIAVGSVPAREVVQVWQRPCLRALDVQKLTTGHGLWIGTNVEGLRIWYPPGLV